MANNSSEAKATCLATSKAVPVSHSLAYHPKIILILIFKGKLNSHQSLWLAISEPAVNILLVSEYNKVPQCPRQESCAQVLGTETLVKKYVFWGNLRKPCAVCLSNIAKDSSSEHPETNPGLKKQDQQQGLFPVSAQTQASLSYCVETNTSMPVETLPSRLGSHQSSLTHELPLDIFWRKYWPHRQFWVQGTYDRSEAQRKWQKAKLAI